MYLNNIIVILLYITYTDLVKVNFYECLSIFLSIAENEN